MVGVAIHPWRSRVCRAAGIIIIVILLTTLASFPYRPLHRPPSGGDSEHQKLTAPSYQISTKTATTSTSSIIQKSNASDPHTMADFDATAVQSLAHSLSPTSDISITPASLCPSFPGSEGVLVVIKTGAAEASRLIPTILSTIALCMPNFVVFSDLDQQIEGHVIHDALKTVSTHFKSSNSDFEFYRKIKTVYRESGDVTMFGQLDENQGKAWSLDKWENILMLHQAHRMYPNVKWHVYIDADTFLGFHNLMQILQSLDNTIPLYIGNVHQYGGEVKFAYGGAGYILSSAAVAAFEKSYTKENVERWEAETARSCCGDAMLAFALREARVRVRSAAPLLQVNTLNDIAWGSDMWCETSLTWHHIQGYEKEQLYEFERSWYTARRTVYRFRDLFTKFVQPNLASIKDNWDNLSADHKFRKPDQTELVEGKACDKQTNEERRISWDLWSEEQREAVLSPSLCRAACTMDQHYVQWLWKAYGSCSHNWSVKQGHRKFRENNTSTEPLIVSGWMLNRVEALEKEWNREDCRHKTSKLSVLSNHHPRPD